ncbi:MAG: SLC13 family permease [Myxococcales bacterium]|nr:SLC13 family permease [Myxococcota bacterium]MDW8283131.1 SLC13 family permease [Myxococcales bacterium]
MEVFCYPTGVSAALVVFALSYFIIAGQRVPLLRLDRPSGALLGCVGMVALGVVRPEEATRDAINHDTIVLLLGMMIVCAYMMEARLFRFASWLTLTRVGTPRRLLVALVFVSGGLSAVLVNDAVCLMFTPLVLQLVRDARLAPLPFVLALAFGSNAGSLATPTGNPQNMLIGTLSGIHYAHFTAALALPALLSLVVVAALLLVLFREQLPNRVLHHVHLPRPEVQPKLAVLCLLTLAGILVGFFAGLSMAWTALGGATLLVVLGRRPPRQVLERVDWILLLFFSGLFVVVYGVGKAGIGQAMFAALRPLLGEGPLVQALVFGIFTVVACQVVSNVPFVLLAAQWIPLMEAPRLMWLSTALFSTLAGNLTIVGSVANMIVLEGARGEVQVGFFHFLRYGALVTGATVAAGMAALWLEHRLGLI